MITFVLLVLCVGILEFDCASNQLYCGAGKLCFRHGDCDWNKCDVAARWTLLGRLLELEIVGQLAQGNNEYITLGFKMAGNNEFLDSPFQNPNRVFGCYMKNKKLDIAIVTNPIKYETFIPRISILNSSRSMSKIEYDESRKRLYCRFNYNWESKDGVIQSDPTNISMLLVAFINRGTLTGGTHRLRTISDTVYAIESSNAQPTSESKVLIQIHGCLMIAGWMLLLSNGIIVAAFYKSNWSNTNGGGKKEVWFQFHMILQSLGLLFVVAAFIIIFVHTRKWETFPSMTDSAHPYLGVISTGIMLINPFIALCRCKPSTPRRLIFNWIHWFVGLLSFLVGMVTLIIGMQMEELHLSSALYPWILATIYLGLFLVIYVYGYIRSVARKGDRLNSKNTAQKYQEENTKRKIGLEIIVLSVIISVAFSVVLMYIVCAAS